MIAITRPFGRALARIAAAALAAVALGALAQSAPPPPAATPATPSSTSPARAPAAQSQPQPQPQRIVSNAKIVPLDRVIAVVNDEALTQHDLNEQKRVVTAQMRTQNVAPPPADVLEKQLLERLITERALLQYAKETGVRVDDVQIERTIARVAQENKMAPDVFRKAVEREGITWPKYREEIRNEIMMQRMRDREVESKISVSDAEVDNFLATIRTQSGGEIEYKLSHILVIVPEQSSPEQIEGKRKRAEEALKQLKSGTDFAQVAAGFSDAPDALKAGDLGWRPPARLPTVFSDQVRQMKPGDVSGVLRSPAGFHIVKLDDVRSLNAPTVVEQTHARHILIKVNEITSESEGKAKIDRIRDRIETGGKFDEQAKLNSEDTSASKGGDLGWISPGDTVPDFEAAMNKLKIDEISPPVRTPFGWHIIQVTERRKQDVTSERQREQARQAMRQRKSEEAFQDWVRTIRDRAYVEMKIEER
jgi:peptidyl-prolyl cis-trans isomerase SurA